MLVVFEVHMALDADPEKLLSEEVKKETHAQLMSLEEAKKLGFAGLPAPPEDRKVVLVAVGRRDKNWVHNVLEADPSVLGFRAHDVDA